MEQTTNRLLLDHLKENVFKFNKSNSILENIIKAEQMLGYLEEHKAIVANESKRLFNQINVIIEMMEVNGIAKEADKDDDDPNGYRF